MQGNLAQNTTPSVIQSQSDKEDGLSRQVQYVQNEVLCQSTPVFGGRVVFPDWSPRQVSL